MAEIRDFQRRGVIFGGTEGAVEGRLGGIRDASPLLAGGERSAGRGNLTSSASAPQGSGRGRERHDENAIDGNQLQESAEDEIERRLRGR